MNYWTMGDPRLWLSEAAGRHVHDHLHAYDRWMMHLPRTVEVLTEQVSERRTGVQPTFNGEVPYELSLILSALRELTAVPTMACPRCRGEQEVVTRGIARGFAGGPVVYAELACGHSWMDESGDVAAAR